MTPITALDAAITALSAVPRDAASYASLAEVDLLAAARTAADAQRLATLTTAVIAGEIARRSAPSLGHDGLAQRLGARTPEELVQVTTGSTKGEAFAAVRVGRLAQEASGLADPATGEVVEPAQPWLRAVGLAVAAGTLSLAAAEAIAKGLGNPTQDVTAELLASAARELIELAASLDADRLLAKARELRDDIDETGIIDRERAIHDRRAAWLIRRNDGSGQLRLELNIVDTARMGELYDRMTSPKRGGPRFVEKSAVALAEAITDDDRTVEQLAYDGFIHLLVAGADADDSQLLGTGAPQVRVTVTAADLAGYTEQGRPGHGRIEGGPAPISMATIEWLGCAGATIPLLFDTAFGTITQPLDVGREQRLFTKRQRIALAARDGGCRWPGCERPPSWCEAHHIVQWKRDDGRTDVADGILLCKHHHLLLHDHGWEIARGPGSDGAEYWLTPPPTVDPTQTPRPMPSKSAAMRDLERTLGAAG